MVKHIALTLSIFFFLQTEKIYSQENSTKEYILQIQNELKSNNPGRNNNRTYDVNLTSNGYFYFLDYYQGKKDGEFRIHIKDIAAIEYEEGMGELYLKIKCKDSKECSLWNNYGDETIFDFMFLRVIDSRSGDYIKERIRKIVLNETGIDINKKITSSNYQKVNNSRTVYFCDSRSAYAYHSRLDCSGLSNCQYQLYSISENEVIKKGYRYCDICWE